MERMPHRLPADRRSSIGFTLIELLVVIAIIAILAAVLFPVFSRAREKSRAAACQSNLHQIALAIFQYAQDNSQHFPTVFGNDVASDPGYGWGGSIQPYIKNNQMFHCPTLGNNESTNTSQAGAYVFGTITDFSDYWYNWDLARTGNTSSAMTITAGCCAGVTTAFLIYPSCTIMNGDGKGYSRSTGTCNNGWDMGGNGGGITCGTAANVAGAPESPSAPYYYSNRHSGGANYAFCDGHVKWLTPQQPVGASNPGSIGGVYNAAVDAPNGSNFTFNIS